MKFAENIITHIPVECLIEDYQGLMQALRENNWELVQLVMDCLAETIDQYTETNDTIGFKPSVSTLVAMGTSRGIVTCNGFNDILCAGQTGVSEAMAGGVLQEHCDNCPHHDKDCFPEKGQLLLYNGFTYDGSPRMSEDLVKSLEEDASCR